LHVAIASGSDARNLEFLTFEEDPMTAASFFEVDVYECAVAEAVDSAGTFWSLSGPRLTTKRLRYGEIPPGWTVRTTARPLVSGCYAAEVGSSTVWFEVDPSGAIREKPDSVHYRDLIKKYDKRRQ
jgi:hypothetical protein